jgi:hypothetical protein
VPITAHYQLSFKNHKPDRIGLQQGYQLDEIATAHDLLCCPAVMANEMGHDVGATNFCLVVKATIASQGECNNPHD